MLGRSSEDKEVLMGTLYLVPILSGKYFRFAEISSWVRHDVEGIVIGGIFPGIFTEYVEVF